MKSNSKRSAALLTLPLCCVSYKYFYWDIFWQRSLARGLWRAGKLCSLHANGMHLNQLRAGVIWNHVLFHFWCFPTDSVSTLYPFFKWETAGLKSSPCPNSPLHSPIKEAAAVSDTVNPITDVLLITKMLNLAACWWRSETRFTHLNFVLPLTSGSSL